MTAPQDRTSRQIILDAITEMDGLGQAITRQRLQEFTGLSYHIVDDHVSRMISEDGILRRVLDGVFELIKGYEAPRAVSITDLDDGQTLIEVGDQQIRLWPRELRILAVRTQGNAMQSANIQVQHDVGLIAHELQLRMARQSQEFRHAMRERDEEIRKLRVTVAERPVQGALL